MTTTAQKRQPAGPNPRPAIRPIGPIGPIRLFHSSPAFTPFYAFYGFLRIIPFSRLFFADTERQVEKIPPNSSFSSNFHTEKTERTVKPKNLLHRSHVCSSAFRRSGRRVRGVEFREPPEGETTYVSANFLKSPIAATPPQFWHWRAQQFMPTFYRTKPRKVSSNVSFEV